MNKIFACATVVLLIGGAGCGPTDTASRDGDGAFGLYSDVEPEAEAVADDEATNSAVEAGPPLPSPDEPPSLVTVDDFVRGQILRDSKHAMSRMVGAIPSTEQKMLLEVQIPQALELFRAQDRKGKYPKDHATFMKEIIEFNQLKLPQLRPGYEYWYDGEIGKLMKRPASQPDTVVE